MLVRQLRILPDTLHGAALAMADFLPPRVNKTRIRGVEDVDKQSKEASLRRDVLMETSLSVLTQPALDVLPIVFAFVVHYVLRRCPFLTRFCRGFRVCFVYVAC